MRMNAVNRFQPQATVKFGQNDASKQKSTPPYTTYMNQGYGGITGPGVSLPEEHLMMHPDGPAIMSQALAANDAWQAQHGGTNTNKE